MAYSTCDLATDVVDHDVEGPMRDERGGWSWTFANACISDVRSDGPAAAVSALRDYGARAEDLKRAAAKVLFRWERGDLAQAIRELQEALDVSVAVDVVKFIPAAARNVERQADSLVPARRVDATTRPPFPSP
jgi:hypothetical protein